MAIQDLSDQSLRQHRETALAALPGELDLCVGPDGRIVSDAAMRHIEENSPAFVIGLIDEIGRLRRDNATLVAANAALLMRLNTGGRRENEESDGRIQLVNPFCTE